MSEATLETHWVGAEALRPFLVPIDSLQDTEGNPDKGDRHVAEIAASLKRFGQVRAILTDYSAQDTIRAGHHVRRAGRMLGWTHIAAIPAQFDDEGEAIAYLLADNRLVVKGEAEVELGQQMTLLDAVGETNLEGTGWSIDDYETLKAAVEGVPEVQQVERWTGGGAESPEEAAARAAAIGQQERHREATFMLNLQEYAQFESDAKALMKHYGTTGVKEAILRCMREKVGGDPISAAEQEEPESAVETPEPETVEDQLAALAAEAEAGEPEPEDAEDDMPPGLA